MRTALTHNTQFLLFCFERANDYKAHVESFGVPFLCIPPYTYHSTRPYSWPPENSIVVVTSSRSFQMVDDPDKWLNRTVYVVGQGTAKAAINLGVAPEYTGRSGGAEIVRKAHSDFPERMIYHVGGKELSEPLVEALERVEHKRIVVYQRSENQELIECQSEVKLIALASTASIDVVTQHSKLKDLPVVCIGETTANRAIRSGLNVLGVCEIPGFESLVELAVSVYNRC